MKQGALAMMASAQTLDNIGNIFNNLVTDKTRLLI